MIFETHAHYNDEAFSDDLADILSQFPEKGIGKAVNIASDLKSIGQCLELAHRYPFMYCALGIHPSDCAPLTDALLEEIRGKLADPRVVAVGEIGLDYYWDTEAREKQRHWFEAQLEMAREAGLPVVIHSREAAQDTLRILQEHRAQEIGGVIHCFSYTLEMAREFVKMGFFIGVGGVVTFKNAKKLKEVAAGIPIDNIVLETDCPYLAPVPFRGKRNSSLYLPYIVEAVAEIRGMAAEEVIARTEKNAERLYRLPHDV
ncbi:MAG: TatD family hydrolase [Eubacteriales bacterium]|nr:TatD family hydrolase [Eubacteriales bacterium]